MRLSSIQMWADYDRETDVLCVSFGKPQEASDSVPTDQGVIVRKKR